MSAGINISISAGAEDQNPQVVASGTITHIIQDSERAIFGINDAQLKSAVNQYFGKAPDDAYVCSPTPWGDLYSSYNWPQVQTSLTAVSAQILENTSNPVIIASQTFTNNSQVNGVFSVGVSTEVTDSVETNWNNTYGFEVGQSISYGINILGNKAEGETSLSFNASFGQGGSQSTTVTMGNNQDVSVELSPGQSVIAQLSASKGTMTVQVTYEVSLSGVTAINYSKPYRNHHFWGLDINSVMNAANIANTYTITEIITIDYSTEGVIKLVDPVTNKEVPAVAVKA